MKTFSVAIGIPTYNRGFILIETIRQVLAQQPPSEEIIVVDQSDSNPPEVQNQLIELTQKGVVRLIRQNTPNLPMARNQILAATQAEIVIFIDDDVVLSNTFVNAHVANYQNNPDVWAVAGRVIEHESKTVGRKNRKWPKVLDYRYFDLNSSVRIEDFGTFRGCNHSVRRKIVQHLGGYDEEYTGVALREEGDLALRIIASGGRIVFDPVASLHHLKLKTGGCRVSVWGDKSAAASNLRFALKHRRLLGSHFIRELWHAYRLGVVNKNTIKHPWSFFCRNYWFISSCLALQRSLKNHVSISFKEI